MKLTKTQENEYLKFKEVVKEHAESGKKLWDALNAIKGQKLYLYEYETWREFCRAELQMTPQWANKLLASKEDEFLDVSKNGEEPENHEETPTGGSKSETSFTSEDQKQEAKPEPKPAAKPTAKTPEKEPDEPTPELDKTGLEIPAELLPLWARRGEMLDMVAMLSKVKVAIEKGVESGDQLWAAVSNSVTLKATELYGIIKLSVPYAVCSRCQGKLPESCPACKGVGLVSEFFWKQCVPKEDKQMRENKINQTK